MSQKYDLAIIGSGPGGLTSAIYAGRADLKVCVIEKMAVGGQMGITMDIANYPGFPDGVDGHALAEKMKSQVESFGAEFIMADATEIKKEQDLFVISLGDKTIEARAVIVATGSAPRKLEVEGEERLRGRGVSYCGTCDAPFFRNRKVAVVGGGDTALKEALYLSKFASEVTIIHRRDELRGEKIYRNQIDKNEKINILWNTVVTAINGEKAVESLSIKTKDEVSQLPIDGIFIFVGTTPNSQVVDKILPETNGSEIKVDTNMMTDIPGLFAVGDVRKNSYRQITTAVGEGATAAMAAEHYLS